MGYCDLLKSKKLREGNFYSRFSPSWFCKKSLTGCSLKFIFVFVCYTRKSDNCNTNATICNTSEDAVCQWDLASFRTYL